MEKLRVKKKNEYVIEVNDKGETISFNLEDPELMLKFDNALQKIERYKNDLKAEELVIKKQADEETGTLLSKNERAIAELNAKTFRKMRDAMDEFLGKGACQKIFGDTNYLSMYEDLFEQLEPHFIRLKLDAEKLKDEIVNKYKDDEEDDL